MKSIINYIRSEWMYWVGAFVVMFALSALNAAMAQETPKSEWSPVGFSQNPKDKTWWVVTDKGRFQTDEIGDTINVVLRGSEEGYQVMLLSTEYKKSSVTSFQILVITPTKKVKIIRGFKSTMPIDIHMQVGFPVTYLAFGSIIQEYDISKD